MQITLNIRGYFKKKISLLIPFPGYDFDRTEFDGFEGISTKPIGFCFVLVYSTEQKMARFPVESERCLLCRNTGCSTFSP